MSTPLTEHFALEELINSQTALRKGIGNMPTDVDVAELKRLCETLLEPVRTLLGVPLHVDSGFRSPALNEAVGGAVNSAHMFGRAADVIPVGLDLRAAFHAVQLSDLPYDQIIIECGAWLHIASARAGEQPRRMALTASGGPGSWRYEEVAGA
jgi:hypothetical protein